jgi:hypothetical protein
MPPENLPERRPRRRSNMSLIVGIIILIIIAGAGYLGWKAIANQSPAETPTTTPDVPVVTDDRADYASTTLHIALKYPKGYTVNDSFINTTVNPNKPISGVKFTIPMEMATGTNLSSDSGLSIEQLPRANKCTGDIFLQANVKPTTVSDGAMSFSVASSSDAGAGNLYEEIVYAIPGSTPCIGIRYFIHSTQFANYPAGTVTQFDHAALIADFDKIRQSIVIQ